MNRIAAASSARDFPGALERALKRNGQPLSVVSQQLREAGFTVSMATLSYWQTGRSLPTRTNSLKAVAALEDLLNLPAGNLTRLLPGERWDPINPMLRVAGVAEALESLDMSPRTAQDYGVRFQEHHMEVPVGHRDQVETIRHFIQCQVPVLHRLPLIYQVDAVDPSLPDLRALAGCRVGEEVQLPDVGIGVVQLELEHPLQRGDMAFVAYQMRWPTSAPGFEHGMARGIPDGVDCMVQSVRFLGELPSSLYRFEVHHSIEWEGTAGRTEEPLVPAPFVQQVLHYPIAGAVGIEWSY